MNRTAVLIAISSVACVLFLCLIVVAARRPAPVHAISDRDSSSQSTSENVRSQLPTPSTNSDSGHAQRVLEIDPALQGLWKVHATSVDGGKSVDSASSPIPFCRATSLHIQMFEGNDLDVDNVVLLPDADGHPANLISFKSYDKLWGITQPDIKKPIYMLQLYSLDMKTEHARMMFTVER